MFSLRRPDSGVPCAVTTTKFSEIQSPAQSNGCHARLRGWPAKVARPKTAALTGLGRLMTPEYSGHELDSLRQKFISAHPILKFNRFNLVGLA